MLFVIWGLPATANDWKLIGFEGVPIYAIAVSPVDKDVLYVFAKDEGLFASSDGGATWACEYKSKSQVNCLAIDRFNTRLLYAGYDDGVLVRIPESGKYKEVIIQRGIKTSSLVLDETSTKAVVIGTAKGIYKSFDQGASFMPAGLSNFAITCLAIDNSGAKAVLYAGTPTAGVFKSANYGTTWTPVNTGLKNLEVYSLLCDMKTPSIIYLGTLEENIYTSENGGDSWQALPINNKLNQGYALAQAIDQATNTTVIYLTSLSGDVHKILERGKTINKLSGQVANIYGICLGITNLVPSILYLGTTTGLLKLDE